MHVAPPAKQIKKNTINITKHSIQFIPHNKHTPGMIAAHIIEIKIHKIPVNIYSPFSTGISATLSSGPLSSINS